MDRDDVIRMAREAGLGWAEGLGGMDDFLERFAQLVAAHERERAEQDALRYRWIRANSRTGLHDSCSPGWTTSHHMLSGRDLDEAVDLAIRNRGNA